MRRTVALALALLGSAAAHADNMRPSGPPLPAYAEECGGCHVPYPPALLPAPSWQRVMANLKSHYGSDATLDPAMAAAIGAWLQGQRHRVGAEPPEDRITRTAWFARKHHEVEPAVWKRKAVGSAARCDACHAGAAEGDFEEDRVRIPR